MERIVTGMVSKGAAAKLVPEKDAWGTSLAISAAMGSTVGVVGALLTPSPIGGKVTCKNCGDWYFSDMICSNCNNKRRRRLGYE